MGRESIRVGLQFSMMQFWEGRSENLRAVDALHLDNVPSTWLPEMCSLAGECRGTPKPEASPLHCLLKGLSGDDLSAGISRLPASKSGECGRSPEDIAHTH
eukprot:1292536-Rhodomonas_salina.1